MLAKRIIPCLDVNEGRVVKGVKFLKLRDAGDPAEVAKIYDVEGADELVFLDITASHQKRKIMLDVARRTAEAVFLPLTIGGGIRTLDDIRELLAYGADKVSINTAAVNEPDFIVRASKRFGSQCIVVAIDAKKQKSEMQRRTMDEGRESAKRSEASPKGTRWEVYINGGRTPTGKDAVEWAKEAERRGAGEILLTSMDYDGTKNGYDLELTRRVADSVNIPIIASGGAGTLEHLYEALTEGGADAVLAASIFHYKDFTIKEAKEYLREKGVAVRM